MLPKLTQADRDRWMAEDREKAARDRQMWLKAAEHAYARGYARGLAKAEAEGLAKAEAEGLAESPSRGDLFGRICLAQRCLRREPTPQATLEAMSLEALAALWADLARELLL